jgi:AraC-like DNA-binding protein
MTVVTEILNGLPNINKPQQKFLAILFSTMLVCHSAINFLSLSRHSALSERTFRRGFRREFEFARLNLRCAERANCTNPIAVALDASFIKKSGKHTFGLDKFWNGSSGRAERGLEVSLLALIDTSQNRAFALSAEQTPAHITDSTSQLPETRMDFYLSHFERSLRLLPASVRYALCDGGYAKEKFVRGVCKQGFDVVSRLRADANLRFLYRGEQRGGRGRPRRFDGKVNLSDWSRFETVQSDEPEVALHTEQVWSVSLKREIRVLVLVNREKAEKQRAIVLFSTDLELDPKELLRLYRSRFQIEFLFRDAKQQGGLESAQARDKQALSFHWNASFACVNLARTIAHEENKAARCAAFSMKSIKQRIFNEHLLELFISKLDLEPTVIKNHPDYEKLRNYAVIAA